MRWLIRSMRRRNRESQLDSELRFHIEQRTAELISQGLDPTEARRHARIAPEMVQRGQFRAALSPIPHNR